VAELLLRQVSKVYPGGVEAVRGLDLHVADGELMVIVGPSGCGKTSTLRMIAGLEAASSGTIRLGDRVVNDLAPGDRGMAMVFQDHGLYPHMSVHENLVFNPRLRKVGRIERERLAQTAADLMGIGHLLRRMPRTLSGGERQRAAVGRAITAEPQCLLFDEPLSNLDVRLREQIRAALKALHRHLGRTTLYVTHDQQEAMALGDRVAVMWAGVLQQVGTPRDVFACPVNRFVAGFIGSPPMSFVEGTVELREGCLWFTDGLGLRLSLPDAVGRVGGREHVGRDVVLGIRPQFLRPAASAAGEDGRTIRIAVEDVQSLGPCADIRGATSGGVCVTARVDAGSLPAAGDTAVLRVEAEGVHLFEPGAFGRCLGGH
jgi:multiple sugar transport system ATP-binding protein